MDVLNSFKELLQISGKPNLSSNTYKSLLNPDAGSSILEKYQTEWAEMHENNEINAEKAAGVSHMIDTMHEKILKQNECILKINQFLTAAPTLQSTIGTCNRQIFEVHDLLKLVENDLIMLEDLIEQQELQERKQTHRQQLVLYEEKRKANLGKVHATLEAKHRQTLLEMEKKEKHVLDERQQVFQDAFKSDLEMYKASGVLPKRVTDNHSSALLEEIQLDVDEKELLDFLEEK